MNIHFAQLDASVKYNGLKSFDCQHDLINRFARASLLKQVRQGLSVAYGLLDSDDEDRFVGFFTLMNHSIGVTRLASMQLGSLPREIPCTRIVMLAIAQDYKNRKLGVRLLKQALRIAKLSAQHVGSFGVYLDADPGALSFYTGLGFSLLEGDCSPAPSPMFLTMSAIDD